MNPERSQVIAAVMHVNREDFSRIEAMVMCEGFAEADKLGGDPMFVAAFVAGAKFLFDLYAKHRPDSICPRCLKPNRNQEAGAT